MEKFGFGSNFQISIGFACFCPLEVLFYYFCKFWIVLENFGKKRNFWLKLQNLNTFRLWLRICQSWKFLQISASNDQFSMYINFLHSLQQFWIVLVKFARLLENWVLWPNNYFEHSYVISACFEHPGPILDSFGHC